MSTNALLKRASDRPTVILLAGNTAVPANTKHVYNINFIQRQSSVFDVGPTLYKCYTNYLRLWGDLLSKRGHQTKAFRPLIIYLTCSNQTILTSGT